MFPGVGRTIEITLRSGAERVLKTVEMSSFPGFFYRKCRNQRGIAPGVGTLYEPDQPSPPPAPVIIKHQNEIRTFSKQENPPSFCGKRQLYRNDCTKIFLVLFVVASCHF